MSDAPLGVLLMTFGSAVTSADVDAYLRSVRGGRPVAEETLREFRRRYDVIGRSPLIEITLAQARELQALLDRERAGRYRVATGMLHSAPHVPDAVDELAAAGVHDVTCIVLAPQYSPLILAGYERAVDAARSAHPAMSFRIADAWHLMDAWIASLASRLDQALAALPPEERDRITVIFTAHSLPRIVVERDPEYITQLRETATAVADRAGLPPARRQFAYQSAGHTPEEWLTPDVKDLLPPLRERGHDSVLVVPVQFLADHLEILYDIDVAAGDEARALGMRLRRIAMPNAQPELVRALRDVVRRERDAQAAVSRP